MLELKGSKEEGESYKKSDTRLEDAVGEYENQETPRRNKIGGEHTFETESLRKSQRVLVTEDMQEICKICKVFGV
jgi:hypothetical protein